MDNFKTVFFGKNKLVVSVLECRGIAVFEEEHFQKNSEIPGWIAYENDISRVCLGAIKSFTPSARQVSLALKGYAAFLNPSLPRPQSLNEKPKDYWHQCGDPSMFSDEVLRAQEFEAWLDESERANLDCEHRESYPPLDEM